ncbi:MAG TPA: methyl-accepting chemotaxis protein, partial [Acetobacteraceae bacterium]|nr:methyl-accepting chemotaxis protein [Acetobacteraceae bacterium]
MSATSEELAAQAEQLQSSIAYFHVDADTAGREPRREAPKRPSQPATAARPARHAPVASPPPRNNAARHKPNGFALNLATGGTDHRDAEFERM